MEIHEDWMITGGYPHGLETFIQNSDVKVCVCFSVSGYVLNLQYDMPLNLSKLCPSPVCIFPMGITLWKQRMTNGNSTPTKMTNGVTLNKHTGRCGKPMGQTHGFRKMIYKWWLEKAFHMLIVTEEHT
jgi:hypothetical protein